MIADYVGFYLGPRSPMLLRIRTGHDVAKVDQSQIVYLATFAQDLVASGYKFVFTDRHSLVTRLVRFFDDLNDLRHVDFAATYAVWWGRTVDPKVEELKQAEFLVHREVGWESIAAIGVLDSQAKDRVYTILDASDSGHRPKVLVRPKWYY